MIIYSLLLPKFAVFYNIELIVYLTVGVNLSVASPIKLKLLSVLLCQSPTDLYETVQPRSLVTNFLFLQTTFGGVTVFQVIGFAGFARQTKKRR